jgi:predicted kinase
MTRVPLIHLICGSTGAGKTTYARKLSAEIGGVHFSIDEWMAALFWMDNPAPKDPAWAIERVERCMMQIWTMAARVAQRGVPCVLDFGFGAKALRERFAGLARERGLGVKLHVLDVPVEERWRRVQSRNGDGSGQLAFAITREMFDFVEASWQAPDAAEMAALNGIRTEP